MPLAKTSTATQPISLLDTNKLYQWDFTVICDDMDWSANPNVGGFIKRVEFKRYLYGAFINAPPFGMYHTYRNFGLWYQAVESIIGEKLGSHNNKNFAKEWLDFLQAEGLEDLAQVPIIYCCTLEK